MRVSESLVIAAGTATVVRAFRAAGATSGRSARRLADLRLNKSSALRELIESRAVRMAGADRYFLDEGVWAQRRRLATGTVLRLAAGVVVVLLVGVIYWSSR
jgi:hypothetical protein